MTELRLAIVGDGKMGRAINDLARERGFVVTVMLGAADNPDGTAISRARLGEAEVVVEFTEPEAAPANIIAAARAGYPVVTGTTGWATRLDEVRSAVTEANGALVHAPNFSIGVNLFLAIAAAAGRIMRSAPEFDAHILETHHAAKKDAPSGTAIALERSAAAALGRSIPTSSVRTGHVPGTHELSFDGAFEQLRLMHMARDRRVFADGALRAAMWVRGKRGIFTMRDVLDLGPETD
jgi:4-hydroxy-tetrahydrodipicolinate reductase